MAERRILVANGAVETASGEDLIKNDCLFFLIAFDSDLEGRSGSLSPKGRGYAIEPTNVVSSAGFRL